MKFLSFEDYLTFKIAQQNQRIAKGKMCQSFMS